MEKKKQLSLPTSSQYVKCKTSWLIVLAADWVRAVGTAGVKDDPKFVHARPNSTACEVNHSNHPCLDCGHHFAIGTGKQQTSKQATDVVQSLAHA